MKSQVGMQCNCTPVQLPVWVWFPYGAWHESKNHESSSGTSGGVFVKVCTHENFPLYGTSFGEGSFLPNDVLNGIGRFKFGNMVR